ncbi:Uma2 family endonuclease [Aquifex aeolicus]|uniref:Putative restriction endonuclease domain-containing protein n=1 Tax=Aquifex aeolicus (strain VF5) TaxID=224324 RepID=O67253_AQUAE|nr:Uma2 family endonuclease [Aquifex aeolicus]AAC07222.1 putative protein [Aquifex aeolicus VF5]
MTTTLKKWTYKDYLKLPDDKRYEIINGELLEVPAPTTTHQRIVGKLFRILSDFVESKELGEVFVSPVDVILSEDNVFQPDIVFVSKDRKEIIKERGIFGAPDLVIEVISPSTLKRDTEDKKKVYEKACVKELWLVFPGEKAVEVFFKKDKNYKVCSFGYENLSIRSCFLKGFELNLKEIF